MRKRKEAHIIVSIYGPIGPGGKKHLFYVKFLFKGEAGAGWKFIVKGYILKMDSGFEFEKTKMRKKYFHGFC